MKKRRVTKEEEDDDSKKRGRPRVERNDESAADRRRTQIRMAQRAYRQRKESTLDELRKRVDELSGIVDSMETAYQECMHRLISAGLPEYATNELRMTASRIAALKVASSRDHDSSDQDATTERSGPAPPVAIPQVEDAFTPKNVPSWLDQTELTRPSRRTKGKDFVDIGLGYTFVDSETNEEQSFYPFRPQSMKLPTNINIGVPTQAASQIPKELLPPKTYSFQESSLGRRIHRACLEAGYSLLLDPSRNLQTYERVFRLPLLGRDRTELVACARSVLDRGPTEPLDLYDAPLIHIGGAGTHYPRPDKDGSMRLRTIACNLGKVGTQTLKLLMQADEQRLTADLAVEIEGYEGEWFDPYDVEGYLAEQGIQIDPATSFTEVEVSAGFHVLGDRSRATSRAATPGLTEGVPSLQSLDALDFGVMPWTADVAASLDSTTDMDSWMSIAQPQTLVPNGSKKMIMVDVTKFIRGLMNTAVCLGQTPGFRRKDVDKALALACYDLY